MTISGIPASCVSFSGFFYEVFEMNSPQTAPSPNTLFPTTSAKAANKSNPTWAPIIAFTTKSRLLKAATPVSVGLEIITNTVDQVLKDRSNNSAGHANDDDDMVIYFLFFIKISKIYLLFIYFLRPVPFVLRSGPTRDLIV